MKKEKKRKPIRTRLTLTFIGLTCTVLAAVVIVFNVAVQGYLRSRISGGLDDVKESVSEDRRKGTPGEKKDRKPGDGRPDRMTGAEYSAAVLSKDGSLLSVLQGDEDGAEELAEYIKECGASDDVEGKIVFLDDEIYIFSLSEDPVQKDSLLVVYADVTPVISFTVLTNVVLLLVILAAVGVSVLLSRRFARSFAEPVQVLSGFATEIGEGKLEKRELAFRDEEFQKLADSMNGMAGALGEAKAKQETFFQNVSHELRTPLTSIRGNAEGIVYGLMEPEAAGRVILSESGKLQDMVEDILYLSRMDRKKTSGAAEPVDLREILSLCVSEQRAEAEKKGLSFSFDFDEDPVAVPIPAEDAERLFGNLISNAVRYAVKEIRLSCRETEAGAAVRVADDGPGIAPEDLPHVFERFYKGEGGKHGIGLAIAKSSAEAWGGSLSARNEGGAVFEAFFPRTESAG